METTCANFEYCVGYWWSDKKSQKLNANKLGALFAERQCKFVKLDFDKHLDQQGPFDVIVHKMGDILVKADQGDAMAKKTISAFESYVRKHPRTVVLDPLDNNRALMDRYKQYRLIEQSDLARENVVFTPTFVHLTSTNIDVNRGRIRRSKITFPIVCKPILAQGSTGAHQMCIIFNEAGLKDVKPPCVAQSFVNHNAKLFKLFVIKDKYYIMERPSLKNFQAGDHETVFFFSHDISKPNSSSSLTELDAADQLELDKMMAKWSDNLSLSSKSSSSSNKEEGPIGDVNDRENSRFCGDFITNGNGDEATKSTLQYHHQSPLMPSKEILSKIVKIFSEKLGLTFYGIDIIIEKGTNRYAIIDMNTFPGYDGVENFLTIFRDVVCDAIPKDTTMDQQQTLTSKLNKRKPTEHDSGIEST
jgi:inositol-1,3,4-trisphosphate 5/6-kinase/inositol-tetrakisphosphate 1-kinase